MTKQFNVRLKVETAEFIRSQSEKLGLSQAEFIETLVSNSSEEFEDRESKLVQIWNDNGRIISMLESLLSMSVSEKKDVLSLDVLRSILIPLGVLMSIKKDEFISAGSDNQFSQKVEEVKAKVDRVLGN